MPLSKTDIYSVKIHHVSFKMLTNSLLTSLKESIKEVNFSTLTADVWTSCAMEAYIGVSCHFITEY